MNRGPHLFKLAHLSDIHLSPLPHARRRDLINKRLLGYFNWHRGRKLVHKREVLDAVTEDVVANDPGHIAVTGDLVNIGLPEEFVRAGQWLEELGPPELVTAIPGNHDAYVRMNPDRGLGHWQDYMKSNEAGELLVPTAPRDFPFVKRYGDIALIALSSAISTAPFVASGRVGSEQRAYLADALRITGEHGLFRIVLIHHPPLPHQVKWRRGLRDAKKVTRIFQEQGVELVLHGHNHETSLHELETASGPAFVIGVPSASEASEADIPAAGYNEYAIDRVDGGWHLDMVTRAPTRDLGTFIESKKRTLRER
jgi:3',5'-cyclic AMP phosphodiesterase CpdA